MTNRKIPKEVEQVFDKYITNFCRRLKKDAALRMFEAEYNLTEEEASIMFEVFDKDVNGELSLWEFNQFCGTIGEDAHNYLTMFKEIQSDKPGLADMDKLFEACKTMKIANGQLVDEEDLRKFIMAIAGQSKEVDLHKFINLVCRIKVHRG